MRISRTILAGLVSCIAFGAQAFAADVTFRSADDALKQGISAYNGGFYELAIPAFEALEQSKPQLARYYLARIYGDDEGAYTDHAKAFALYQELATELQDVDADDEELAPIAAKSLTAVSTYLRGAVPDAKVKTDVAAADRWLHRAALFFNDEDAQFELAKVLLRGEGPDVTLGGVDDRWSKVENGRHWLSRLSRNGHSGAQAFLADLMWRGKYVDKDPATALTLIDVAVANAPASERVWIEDIYQNIFCNAGEGVRQQATGRVAEWRNRYGRQPERRINKSGLDDLTAEPIRTCANGEVVRPMLTAADPVARAPRPTPPDLSVPASVTPPVPAPSVARTTPAPFAPPSTVQGFAPQSAP